VVDIFNELAIYLMRGLRGRRLKEVCREFGIKKYSSVSSIIERMKSEISRDRNLRERVEKVEAKLYKSQVCS
jgi:chromosomal replication initiation ATPase DnaA